MSGRTDFYEECRHNDELPIGTRVRTIACDGLSCPFGDGQTGTVVGHQCAPGAIVSTGWNYILFDNRFDRIGAEMPYVHRDYLEVIE